MPAQPLRLHRWDADRDSEISSPVQAHPYCTSNSVTVAARDVLPLLVDAALTHRAWLDDFADDHLEISQDLYQVLLAYSRMRREAA